MWRTLEYLSQSRPDDEFVLIIGADNWLAFNRWAHYEEILSRYELAVYPRPGYPIDTTSLPTNVHVYSTMLFPENSTEIRRRLVAGESIHGLVPLKIETELTKNKH
jgi:nicotinate-nucleotide adenylyltransferase